MYRIICFVGCVCLLSYNLYSQSAQIHWVNLYNGPANYEDIVNAMLIDNEGNIYVTGKSYGIGSNYNFTTIKYNSVGELLWVSRYNLLGNSIDWDIPTAIAWIALGIIKVVWYYL